MYQTNFDKRSLRSALLLGAASAAAISISLPALADDQGETVVVTGSRIPQTGLYSASPITAVGQDEIKYEGTTDVVSLVDTLPSVFVDQNSFSNNGATGTATINLRGLGSERTLVLVDGTRLMPGDPTEPVADVNTIPAALIDHVEVETGGASATYGSDAEAGVVNFIMRKDFEGVEVDGQWSGNEHTNSNHTAQGLFNSADFTDPLSGAPQFAPNGSILDGESQDLTLVMGTNSADGKGNVTGYLGYRNSGAILGSTRDFSACTLGDNGNNTAHICAGSANYGLFGSIDNEYTYFGINANSPGFNGQSNGANVGTPCGPIHPYLAGYYFETGKGANAKFGQCYNIDNGAPNQKFNYGALNYNQRPDTRYNGGFMAHYQVNKELDVYSDLMFTDDRSTAQLAPSAAFDGDGPLTNTSGAYAVNCSNPYLTTQENQVLCGLLTNDVYHAAGTNSTAIALGHGYWDGAGNLTPLSASVGIGRRNIEGGDRTYTTEHESYRMKVGARGDLGDGWTYDAYAQFGYTSFSNNEGGQLSKARIQDALNVDPATGECESSLTSPPTSSGCAPLDIFQGFGGISPAAESYITVPTLEQGFTKEEVISGSITGDLGAWGVQSPWAKSPVAVSFGSEYREEGLGITPDAELSAAPDGDTEGGGRVIAQKGQFDVVEGFTEVKLPVIQDRPFAEDLSLNGGYRYSSYNISGSTNAYKAGFEYQPIDDFRLRGSIQHAVRAPNVLELFASDVIGLFGGLDPCVSAAGGAPTAANIQILANCASAPGAAHFSGAAGQCPASQCNDEVGGNEHLKPEVSETHSIGIVLTPTFLNGFTATVDYFDIDIANTIGGISPGVSLAECYGVYATAATQASYCPFIHRGGSGGPIFGAGYVDATTINGGHLGTKGFDFEANYTVDLASWGLQNAGSLHANMVGTLLNNLTIQPIEGGLNYDCAGLYGDTCGSPAPKWRHKLRVTWTSPWDFSLSLNWRHESAVSLDQNTNNPLLIGTPDPIDGTLASEDYFDLAGDWNVREGVDLRAGVNNIFDRDPPITAIQPLPEGAANTFPGNYDINGRYIFVGATIKY